MAIYRNWAPSCAYPGCINLVGYHSQYRKANGTMGYKWKRCCEVHRTTKKNLVDDWKMSQGCLNVDGRYGFICTATIISPEQLDIHHRDGNKRNNDPDNLDCICGNCHSVVTLENKDHLNTYDNCVELPETLWEISE
jgi:hypothetical protein